MKTTRTLTADLAQRILAAYPDLREHVMGAYFKAAPDATLYVVHDNLEPMLLDAHIGRPVALIGIPQMATIFSDDMSHIRDEWTVDTALGQITYLAPEPR